MQLIPTCVGKGLYQFAGCNPLIEESHRRNLKAETKARSMTITAHCLLSFFPWLISFLPYTTLTLARVGRVQRAVSFHINQQLRKCARDDHLGQSGGGNLSVDISVCLSVSLSFCFFLYVLCVCVGRGEVCVFNFFYS